MRSPLPVILSVALLAGLLGACNLIGDGNAPAPDGPAGSSTSCLPPEADLGEDVDPIPCTDEHGWEVLGHALSPDLAAAVEADGATAVYEASTESDLGLGYSQWAADTCDGFVRSVSAFDVIEHDGDLISGSPTPA